MQRVMTLREYAIEELNRLLAAEGRDVLVVAERPHPQLATSNGANVISFDCRRDNQERNENE